MLIEQKRRILELRQEGSDFATIANDVKLSVNTVKSFYRRHTLKEQSGAGSLCRYCGKVLVQTPKVKPKHFCSEVCRRAWWKEHPEAGAKKAFYEKACAFCGKPYTVYGRADSKYCSLECAHRARRKAGNEL